MAKHLNRGFAGYDTVENYVRLATARLAEPLSLRSEQLIAVFEKIGLDDPTGGPGLGALKRRRLIKKKPNNCPLPLFEQQEWTND